MAPRASSRAAACAAAVALALAGCGKKAPLRLPGQGPAEDAGGLAASVREDVVRLTFRVPPRRIFPERQAAWVLARVLRKPSGAESFTEAAALHEPGGFEFGETLTWSAAGHRPSTKVTYRVEFRDADRRRRAVTRDRALQWSTVPPAPAAVRAVGGDGTIAVSWQSSGESPAVLFRVYRRRATGPGPGSALGPAPAAGTSYLDSGLEPGSEHCYAVRSVALEGGLEVEGPASDAACAAAVDALPPPPPAGLRFLVGSDGAVALAWDPVAAPDLLGYHVWRATGDGVLERITVRAVGENLYRDEPPPPGSRSPRRYAVTAVDRSPQRNESAFSPMVTVEP